MKWSTVKRKVNDLIPNEFNPREMTKSQVKHLKESLEKFDLAEIPAINTDNTILAGHQRIQLLTILGRSEEMIDVRIPERQLTKEEANEYMLRSNKNVGQWNLDVLASFDKSLLELTGFNKNQINKMFQLNTENIIKTNNTNKSIKCPNCGHEFVS